MDQSEFTATLEKLLAQLNREKSIAFGLNLCERLFPNYIDFSTKRRWGNPALLQEAIQYCRDNKRKSKKMPNFKN